MRRLLALSLVLPLAFPALAGPPPAALGVLIDFTRPDETLELEDEPAFTEMSIGALALDWSKMTLDDLARDLGGAVSIDRTLGVGLAWLCYVIATDDGPRRLSLLGLAGEDGAQKPLLGLALEPDDPASNARHGCAAADVAMPDLGIPGLGESRAAIARFYGVVLPKTPRINLVHETFEDDTLVLQQLQYLLAGDTIIAVALTRSTL
jgi:hypothetical protein